MADKKLAKLLLDIEARTGKLEKQLEGVVNKSNKASNRVESTFKRMGKEIARTLGALFGLKAVVDFGKKILNTASQFEQLKIRLTSLYGEAEKAKQVFKVFKNIASTTPFSLKNVVEAGATLKAFGLEAENTLKPVTDLAAFMGLDVVEAANAVGRAYAGGVGAADVLRERGVLNLIKSFKGIDDLSKLTLPEFREALIESMQDPAAGIAGSTDRMSKSFAGAYSNMNDALDNFAASLGTGALPGLRNLIKQTTAFLELLTPTTTNLEEANVLTFNLSNNFNNLTATYVRLSEKTKLTKEESELYRGTISKLQKEYPNYLKNIDLHKDSLEKVKTAFEDARKELDKYITSLMNQAIIEDNKEQISELAGELAKYTVILNGLEIARDQLNQTGEDPFTKLTTQQRNQLINAGDLVTKFRVTNIFNPLDEQISGVKNRISELSVQRDNLKKIIKQMVEVFQDSLAPKGGDDDDSGDGGAAKKMIDLQNKLFNELKFRSADYIKFRVKQINEETEAMRKAGLNQIDVEQFKLKKLLELRREFAAQASIKGFGFNELSYDEDKKGRIPEVDLSKKVLDTINATEKPNLTFEESAEQLETILTLSEALENGFKNAAQSVASLGSQMFTTFTQSNNILLKYIGSLVQAIAQTLILAAVTKFVTTPVLGFLGLNQGGDFVNAGGRPVKAAQGIDFKVPPGYLNDSFPVMVESGERVRVTSARETRNQESEAAAQSRHLKNLVERFDVMNERQIEDSILEEERQDRPQEIFGRVSNNDIYFSNKKGGRTYNRIRG